MVLGAGGMLGHQLAMTLNKLFPESVYGTVRKSKQHYEPFHILPPQQLMDGVDMSDPSDFFKTLDEQRPDWIVNAIGITLRKSEIDDFSKCLNINSLLPKRLELWAQSHEAKVIHFSTDCVFDGSKTSPYLDFDPPTARDIYGISKYLGEISGPHALTFRLSIVGRELESKSELVEWFLRQKGKTVNGFAKTIYSGLTTVQVAKEVGRVIKEHPHLCGLYHLASQPISKYDLLELLNEEFQLGVHLKKDETHVSNKALDFKRYSAETGFQPPPWPTMIKEMVTEQFSE